MVKVYGQTIKGVRKEENEDRILVNDSIIDHGLIDLEFREIPEFIHCKGST